MCVISTKTREGLGKSSVRFRLSLGSNLSRLCLASLICLCMLTVGVGNAWGATFTKITSLSDLTTGDYVIVGQKSSSSWGKLVYGSLSSGRLTYSSAYSSLPSSITTTTANEIWHLTVSGTGTTRTVTIYNAGQKKYLKGNGLLSFQNDAANWTAAYSSGFRLLGTKASNFLGVNKDYDYWRDYVSSTLYNSNTYCLTLYKAPSGFALTFKETGGSSNGSGLAAANATSMTISTAPTPATGKMVEGYYAENTLTTKVANADGSWAANNITGWVTSGKFTKGTAADLYIKWTDLVTTLTLDKGTDGTTDGTATITYNATSFTSKTDATKTGYHLSGYYTASSGGNKVINADGALVSSLSGWTSSGKWIKNATTEKLYAQWTIDDYTVSWSVNGNSWSTGVSSSNNHANYNNKITAMPTAPTSSNCDNTKVFVGWTATPIVGTQNTPPSDLFTAVEGSPKITQNTTFYAVFATNATTATRVTATNSITSGDRIAICNDKDSYILLSTFATAQSQPSENGSGEISISNANQQWLLNGDNTNGYTLTNGTIRMGSSNGTSGSSVSNNANRTLWTFTTTNVNSNCLAMTNKSSGYRLEYSSGWVHYNSTNASWTSLKIYKVNYTNYATSCCTPLGSINGSINVNNATSVTLTWEDVTGAEKYQVKVPGSSSHNDWTDAVSGVSVTKSCGTAYTAYFRAIDTDDSHCSVGPESTLAIPAVSWTVSPTISNGTASPAIPGTTCNGFSTTISPETGYALPAEVTVTNASHTWNSSTGALTISDVTGNVAITVTCAEESCSGQYTFDYGGTKQCFSQVGETDEFQITGFTIPTTTTNYWVGYDGYFYDSNLGTGSPKAKSANNQFKYMPVANLQGSSCGGEGEYYKHAAEGAYGTLRIFQNYSDDNLYIGFVPAGYQMRVGSGDSWSNIQLTQDGSVWTSALMTLDAATVAKNYYVNIYTGSSYSSSDEGVAINNWTNGGSTISSMVFKTGAGDNWDTSSGLSAGMKGKFRVWSDNCANNGYAHFVPYYQLQYNSNGGTGSMSAIPATPVSCEETAANRTVTVAANSFTAPTYKQFSKWNTAVDGLGSDVNTGDYELTSDVTLYAQWVNIPVTNIELNHTGLTKYAGEASVTLTASITPATANPAVTWSSSDETVASVTSAGVVSFLKAGTATITATSTITGSQKATCTVTVRSVSGPTMEDEDGTTISGSGLSATWTVGTRTLSASEGTSLYKFKEWVVTNATPANAGNMSTTLGDPTGNVTVKAVFYKPVTVAWKVGNSDAGGTPTTAVKRGTKISALPTTPADNAIGGCANKFMGWSATTELTGTGHDAPADLFTSTGDAGVVALTAPTTYRAVYATASGGGSGSFEISTSDFGNSYSSTESTLTKLSTNDIGYKQIRKNDTNNTPSGWCANACTEIRGSSSGHGELYNKSSISGLNKLRVYEVSGASNLTVYYGTSSKANSSSVSSPFASATGTESVSYDKYASSTCTESNISLNYYDVTIPSGNDYFYIYASSAATIYKIIVYYATTSYSDYVTNCCSLAAVTDFAVSSTTANSVTLTWTAPSPSTGITKLQVVDGNGTVKVDDLAASATGATVSGLTECDEYSFIVRSVGASCYTESDPIDAQPYSGAKTVTYKYHDDATADGSFSTSCGNASTTLPTPTRENYRFEGWYTEASGGTRKGGGGDSYTPDATITLHAQWTRVYTVSYAYAGGSGSCAGGSYAAGETVTTCATATKAGSTLTGWTRSDNSATVTPGNTFTMPASNVTLTAVWEDTPYTLTQIVGSHTTKGHAGTTITSGDLASSGLDLTYTISDNAYALPKAVTISGGGQTWTLGTNYTWSLSADKHSATLHIEADLTISADVTVTVTEQARYTVIWDEHGSTTTEYYAADDNTVTLKTGIADCGEKKFYGWTEDAVFASHATTPPTMASSGAISADKHYYAIFADADEPANPGYNKITSYSNIVDGGTYLIVAPGVDYNSGGWHYEQYAYAGDNGNNKGAPVAVTFTDVAEKNITSKPASAKEVELHLVSGQSNQFTLNYDETHYLKAANGNDLYHASFVDNDGAFIWNISSTEGHVGAIQSYAYSSRYLSSNKNNSGTGNFACYGGTQADAYLYLKETTAYSNFSKTCTLYDIEITTPSGGEVTTTPAEGTGVAGEGQTITVNVTPNSCKYLSALKYNDGSDHAISIASTPYTFTMPASDVTVTATFADKTVSSIDPVTSTHRTLMQGTSFEGEQIRVTYNNGETEDLAWNASGLTFSGYNMSTLGDQTVSVAYVGSCGNANTSYDIEITDGIPVTFSDCGITTVNKYDPGATVPVKSTLGEYGCSGWVFDGWSETPIVHGSTAGYTIVENFSASVPKTLYAVYVKKENTYTSIDDASELLSGFQYAIMRQYSYDNHMILKAEAGTGVNAGYLVAVNEYDNALSYSSPDYTLTSTEEKYAWQLQGSAGNWVLYNKSTNKYLDLSTAGNAEIESAIADRFTITQDAYDDHLFTIRSNTNTTYYLTYNSSYYKSYTSAQMCDILRRAMQFSSTPPCAPQAAIFHGNGGTVIADGGTPTGGDLTIREATRDAGITTPTAEYEDCDGKSWSFIGWADHEVDVTRVPVLTTDLLNDGGGNKSHTITTDGEQFWAVYTNQGEALTKYGTISFIMSDFSKNYLSEEHTVTKVVSGDNYVFGDKRIGHASETGIQFEAGTGELYNKTSLGKINSISFGSFAAGALSNLRVYVGNSEKATTYELTAAELQVVGGVSTYYPTHDCEYVYIKSGGTYACVTSISIDFGKGTKVWATTPDCKRVTLSGDIYATSTNGRGIMAVTPLHVNAFQLDASAGIVITSNSSDVYFTENRTPNFAMAAANQPKNSITLTAGLDGNLTTDIYVHYKPGSAGDGVPADVNVYANLAEPDPGVTATHPIHVRNMPEKFVIAAKVGAAWYALPADMSGAAKPGGVLIDVDETNMTAVAPNTCSYTIWPVKTVNPNISTYDRYGTNATYDGNAFGERVRFSAINNSNKGLWANNANGGNTINNSAAITAVSDGGTTDNTNPSYEWKITTSVTDGKWSYTLQTDQTQNDRYLRYWLAASGGPKWGTYASGENNLYFLPVTEVEPFEMQVVEWYPTKVLVQTEAALASPTVKVNSESVASPVLTNKGGKLWEISGLPLENNPTKSMTVAFTADEKNYACTKTVPVIISRGTKTQASEPFATLGTAIYNNADLVVRDGAVLTVDGTIAANTFYDVTIYPTSKISVPSDKKLTVHSLTFFGGIDEIYDGSAYAINKYGVPELSLKGRLHKSIAQIDYVMRVDDSQMYSLTVPYDVNLADITYWDGTSMGTLGDKLWVSAYDGAARANKDMSHTWIWEANFASKGLEEKLKAGVGYTISADLQVGVGATYSVLRMPMASNVANDGTELAKTVPVVAYGSESAVSDNHKGWNLVGNPYMVSISGGDADSKLEVGYLQETGTGPWEWVRDTYRYVTIPADNGQDYWQEKFSSATLKPFKNFFLQIATSGDLSFALASRQDAPARYLEAQKREVEFEINLANGSHEDHTGLLIAEEYSPAYEINADLEKMENAMAVYTLTGGYKLAYNALSPDDASQPVPVGYVANVAGTYTFDLDETSDVSEVEHIWLTDYELDRVVDLIDGAYEFTTANGRNESRFALSIELKDEQQTPTGINALDADNEKPLKFLYRDKIYILRNGVIYDATGKQVKGGLK